MNPMNGPGGAPTRATTFPLTAKGRKETPIASGVLDYFPDALIAVARVSWAGNEQHNPGKSLRWDREKSGDESDALLRHFLQRGTVDDDGHLHSAKLAWRALALLQKEIEEEDAYKLTLARCDKPATQCCKSKSWPCTGEEIQLDIGPAALAPDH